MLFGHDSKLPSFKSDHWINRHLYPPMGRCLYCGATTSKSVRLSDEHMIARSLGGVSIIPEASCLDCAKITSYLEGYCANNIFNSLRVQRRLPTRRPKKRPTHLPTYFEVNGLVTQHLVNPAESVSSFAVYLLPPPGIVAGRLPSNSYDFIQERLIWTIANSVRHFSYAAKIGATRTIAVAKGTSPYVFARMLAKIAHAYASAQGHLVGFRPLLPDIILGKSDKIPYLVGMLDPITPPRQVPGWVLSAHYCRLGYMTTPQRQLCFATVRLFGLLPTPTYTVIVGERSLPGPPQ